MLINLKNLTLLIAIFSPLAFSNPTKRFEPESQVEAFALASRLKNSTWEYRWRSRDFKFRFNQDGSIGLLKSWKNVYWVVTGREDVILEAGNKKMLLQFSPNQDIFSTTDWDGEKASGRLILKGQ